MNDLVSRKAVIERLLALTIYKTKRELVEAVDKSYRNQREWIGGVAECIDEIEDMDGVDAVPVVHGEWIELPDKADRKYSHICSACHRFHIAEGEAEFYHYCPNCGAKMDGKEQSDG